MTNQSVAKELETTARRRPKRRRLADEALRESEERFRTIVDASPDAVVLTDIEGRIRMASLAALDLFGCQGEDLRGRPIADFVKPGERGRARNLIQEVLHDGGPSPRQYMGLRGDGITVALEVNSRVIRGAEGRPAEILLLIRDVTQRIQTHAALAASEGRFRTMVNASPDTITITDLASRIVMISPAGLEMLGYEEPADLTGRSVEEFLAEEDRERARANIALMFEGVFKGPEEYGIRRADGSLVEVEINGDFIRDESGTATHVVYVIRDITERNRAQADLRASEERHRTILQTAMDGFWLVDRDGRLLDVNEAYCRMSGYTAAELLNMSVTDVSLLETRDTVRTRISAIMEKGSERFESTHRRKDGTRFTVEASVQYFPFEGGRLVAFLRDVTEQRRSATELRQSHDMIAKLTAQVPGVVYQYRMYPDGRSCFPFASPGAREICEITPEEVRDDATAVFARLHPDDYDRVKAMVLESARTMEPLHCEFRVVLPRQGLRWRLSDAMPERTDDGGTLWHGIISDITERREADDALRQSLKEKSALLQEVHHRVKNNLQVITRLLRLETSRSDAPVTKRVLRDMQGRILAMAALHETLYRTGRFGQVELGGYLGQLAQQLFRTASSPARLDLGLSPVAVGIDQAIPCGLIVNELLTNSLKHAFVDVSPGVVTMSLAQDGQGEVRLTVSDTGVGLPVDFEAKAGRSLGLQLVTDLVRQIRGSLVIKPGPGAEFVVTFTRVLEPDGGHGPAHQRPLF